jgi:hypothetical protein
VSNPLISIVDDRVIVEGTISSLSVGGDAGYMQISVP